MIIIVGLVVAFVLVMIFANRQTRQCRWREDRREDADGMKKYKCMTCGAETFTSNGKPPLVCRVNAPDTKM